MLEFMLNSILGKPSTQISPQQSEFIVSMMKCLYVLIIVVKVIFSTKKR